MAVEEGSVKKAACVRLATKVDVPVIKLLIEALAKFEKQSQYVEATESALESMLFQQPPFWGPTVFLLELGLPPSPSPRSPDPSIPIEAIFNERCFEVNISTGLQEEPSSPSFVSSKDESRVVVGFVHFFPTYSSFLAKGGLTIGDFYVREAYRRQGLGKVLLQTVAEEAAKRKLARAEWCVLDWNVNAIKFYESMGAVLIPHMRVFRLSGDALRNYAE